MLLHMFVTEDKQNSLKTKKMESKIVVFRKLMHKSNQICQGRGYLARNMGHNKTRIVDIL